MSKYQLSVISDGGGASLEALVVASKLNLIPFEISFVSVTGGLSVEMSDRVNRLKVPVLYAKQGSQESLENFHHTLAVKIKEKHNPDLVLFLNGIEAPTKRFLQIFPHQTLVFENFFPQQFERSSGKILDCLKCKIIKEAGLTVRWFTCDPTNGTYSSTVLETIQTPFEEDDTVTSFVQRVQLREKSLLISSLFRWMYFHSNPHLLVEGCLGYLEFNRRGKVRDLYNYFESPDHQDHLQSVLCVCQTSRLSSFDRHITEIKGRGELLTIISEWWFKNTSHIIPNHLLGVMNDTMFVKPTKIIPFEVVVRAYITGTTKTSLWVNYQASPTNSYCGITFPAGLKKNQRLENLVITPTTKGEVDVPISEIEIVEGNHLTKADWGLIREAALNLFQFGQKIADKMGYILVDTKYEFGYDSDGQIILIDEIHTPDSSRYWVKKTYQERFDQGVEPEKIDKDGIRDYLKSVMDDPYHDPIPEIPEEKKEEVLRSYFNFTKSLVGIKMSFEKYQENVKNLSQKDQTNSELEFELVSELDTVLAPEEIQLLHDQTHHGKYENELSSVVKTLISKTKGHLYIVTNNKQNRNRNQNPDIQTAFSKKAISSSLTSLSLATNPCQVEKFSAFVNRNTPDMKILIMIMGDPEDDLSVYLYQNTKCPVLFMSPNPDQVGLERNADLVNLILKL